MKKICVILSFMLCLLALGIAGCNTPADDFGKGLIYSEKNNGYAVAGYEGESSEVVIPETYNGKPVIEIASKAFVSTNIVEITLPKSITAMGIGAFEGCTQINKVTFNGTIDQWVMIRFGNEEANPISFSKNLIINGQKVTEVTLTTATSIENFAFFDYSPLLRLSTGNLVSKIGVSAFEGCSLLANLTLGSGVQSFEYRSFGTCSALSEVNFPNSVTTIAEESFRDCANLKTVYIPASVTCIEKAAFNYNSKMDNVVFEVTEGWFVTAMDSSQFGTDIEQEVLSNPIQAGKLLSTTYSGQFWKRI